MKVAMHVNPFGQLAHYMKSYEQILIHNKIKYNTVNSSDPDFWAYIREYDLFIYRYAQNDYEKQIGKLIIPLIDSVLSLTCYPNRLESQLFDDKIEQQIFFSLHGCPIIDGSIFFSERLALQWLENASLPLVFKLSNGAASENVIKVNNLKSARTLTHRMFNVGMRTRNALPIHLSVTQIMKWLCRRCLEIGSSYYQAYHTGVTLNTTSHRNYVYFQKYLPFNYYDTRITVIGNRAFAFRRHNRKDDFRASGSGMIDYDFSKVDSRCINIAFDICSRFGFRSMAFDFLFDPNGTPYFCETSYTFVDKAIYACPGFFDHHSNFIEGHYWPAYCLLSDLLQDSTLKQP